MKRGRFIAVLSVAALSACSGNDVKSTLGLERGSPDEFRVVSRPPLSVPPQFDLQPPSPVGAPAQVPASKQAQSMMLGGAKPDMTSTAPALAPAARVPAVSASGPESQFLKDAGADQANPKIRATITEDNVVKQDVEDNSNWWDIFSSNPPKKDPTVDAQKENDRIKTNDAQGQPVTTGDTPTAKDSDTGILGRIFGY